MADNPNNQILHYLASINLIVLAIKHSKTTPHSSSNRCISSIINKDIIVLRDSDFLVTTSHFSGVETIIWVNANSFLDKDISPVNSQTSTPKYDNFQLNFQTTSVANAFNGDI